MEFTLNARFLGCELQRCTVKDVEHDMLKMTVYSNGETVDLFVLDTHANFDELAALDFGADLCMTLRLVKRDSGGYKVKFISLI